MDESAVSMNGISIRLPDERWEHIVERHNDLANQKQFVLETISSPDRILLGNKFPESEDTDMATINSEEAQGYLKLLPVLQDLPKRPFMLLYDAEVDVLYIDFYNPPKSASDSEITDNDVVIRYDDANEIVGLTVLDATRQQKRE